MGRRGVCGGRRGMRESAGMSEVTKIEYKHEKVVKE